MKVIDRYITRELFIPIISCSVILIFLLLIADLFDNLDELLRYSTPSKIIFRYYLSMIPQAFSETIPWASWLGTMFLLVNFGIHNEITAMKTAGVKITGIIRPILFLGFLIGIFTFIVIDRVIPTTSKTAEELREIYIEKKKDKRYQKVHKNVTYYAKANELYYFQTYLESSKTVNGVIALWLHKEEGKRSRKMVAKKGIWKDSHWEFEGVNEYQMDSLGRILGEPKTFQRKIYEDMKFSPQDLSTASSQSSFLTYKELKKQIGKLEKNGVDVRTEYADLHYRLAAPWQALVMMLLTIPFLAHNTQRKAIAFQVLLCVGVIFTYHVTGAIGLALGKASKLFPFVSAWAGNIIFTIGALLNLDRANY